MALSPAQTADATKIYNIAVQRGLPPQRARELVLAAFHEGGLNPNAHNPSGAEGDFQLLSSGYVDKANQLGGVHDTRANELAILPDYQHYWQQHPHAGIGEAAAAVERSGKGADYYGAGGNLLSFLGSVGGKPPASTMPVPPQIGPAPSVDPRTQFALAMAQSIGSHKFDPAAISGALAQLHSSEQAQPDARHVGDNISPLETIGAAAHNAAGAHGPVGQIASRYLGIPYKWGGTSVKGMDCSAFLQNVMGDLGVKIPRTTYEQVKHGQPIGLHQLQPGDAIFTEPGHAGPNHVGLYVGNGMVQESPHTGDVNKLIPLDTFLTGGFVAARRYR